MAKFSQDDFNQVLSNAHCYTSKLGLRIIHDITFKGYSSLEDYLFDLLDVLNYLEVGQDYCVISDPDFQAIIEWLSSEVGTCTSSLDDSYSFIYGTGVSVNINPLSFLQLSDTPKSYVGQENKLVAVNTDGTGLIFTDATILPTLYFKQYSLLGDGSLPTPYYSNAGNGLTPGTNSGIILGGALDRDTSIDTSSFLFNFSNLQVANAPSNDNDVVRLIDLGSFGGSTGVNGLNGTTNIGLGGTLLNSTGIETAGFLINIGTTSATPGQFQGGVEFGTDHFNASYGDTTSNGATLQLVNGAASLQYLNPALGYTYGLQAINDSDNYLTIVGNNNGTGFTGFSITDDSGIQVEDDNGLGMFYASDYSASASNPRWIPDIGFLSTYLSTIFGFDNGITNITGNIYGLGGNLTQNTQISLTGNNLLIIGSSHNVILTPTNMSFQSTSGTSIGSFTATSGTASMSGGVTTNGHTTSLIMSGTATVYSSADSIPINYAADYSGSYSSRSLIDKGYADSHYGSGSGSVTTVSIVTANGFSGTVATATTTPAITLTLQNATTSQSGQLTFTDWNTFNNKLSTTIAASTYQTLANLETTLTNSTTLYPSGSAVQTYITGLGYLTTSSASSTYLAKAGGTMTGNLILNADPSTALGASTKQYVDNTVNNAITGLQFITAAKVASTANVTVLSAPSSIDGVSLSNGDRVLLKNQTTATENGVYLFNGTGSALTRSTDASVGSQIANKTVPVYSGTSQADTWWTITNDSITIGVTNIVIVQTGGSGSYAQGTGIIFTGNVISADTSYLATLASPTFSGTPFLPSGTTGVTQSTADNSTKLATTAYVQNSFTANTIYFTTGTFSGSGTLLVPYYLTSGPQRTHMIDFMGDSMTAAATYPNYLISLLPTGWTGANFGISGDNTQGMINRFVSITTGAPEYTIILAGVNDLTGGVYTATQTIANLQAMATAAHNAGSKVVMITILPFGANVGWTSGIETNRGTVNTAILSTITNVDYRINADPVMWDPSNHTNLNPTYDSGDHKHPNTLGYQTLATAINSAVTFTQSSTVPVVYLAKNATIDQDLQTSSSVFFKGVSTTNLSVVNDIAGSIPAPVMLGAYVSLLPATQGAQAFDSTKNALAWADGSVWQYNTLQNVATLGASYTGTVTLGGLLVGPTAGNTGGIINNVALSGATSVYGYNAGGTIGATATSAIIYYSNPTIAASSPIVNLFHFRAGTASFGSTPTTEYGYYFGNSTGATNVKAFDGEVASGSGKYNLYMGGTAANFLAGVTTISTTSLGATPTDYLIISNTTAAALGAQQLSPALNFEGFGWGTTAGTSQAVNARIYNIPVQGATASGALNIDWSLNGGAYATKTQFFSSGSATIGGGTGTVSAGLYTGNVSSFATTSTDALVIANTSGATSGVPVQYSGRLRLHGTVWNTTATAASNLVDWGIEVRPVSALTPTSALYFMKSLVVSGNPTFSDVANLADTGTFTAINLTASGYFTAIGTTNNLFVPNAFSGASTGTTNIQYAGSSTNFIRVAVNGGTTTTLTTGTNYSSFIVGSSQVTTFGTGTHPWLANAVIAPIGTINSSGATVNNATTLFVGAAPTTVATNKYTAYFDTGNIQIANGNLTFGTAGNRIFITEGSNGIVGQTTLVAGTKAITITGLTSSSRAFPGFVSQGGTSTGVFQYAMVCTTNTLTITAVTVAGVTVATDTSTINYLIIN